MSTPGFTALSALNSDGVSMKSGTGSGEGHHLPIRSANHFIPQTLPTECWGSGYTKSDCYGVVLVCEDCCQSWRPGSGYIEVCGDSYACGACFGLPF